MLGKSNRSLLKRLVSQVMICFSEENLHSGSFFNFLVSFLSFSYDFPPVSLLPPSYGRGRHRNKVYEYGAWIRLKIPSHNVREKKIETGYLSHGAKCQTKISPTLSAKREGNEKFATDMDMFRLKIKILVSQESPWRFTLLITFCPKHCKKKNEPQDNKHSRFLAKDSNPSSPEWEHPSVSLTRQDKR